MRYSLSNQRITEGMVINEILFGQGYEASQKLLTDMDIELKFDLNDYYICLTGIPKRIFTTYLEKDLDNFFQLYSSLRDDIQSTFAELGIKYNIAVVKYDESKRICCIFTTPKEAKINSLYVASFIHERITSLYEKNWALAESGCVCLTAVSNELSGFDKLRSGFRDVRKLSELFFFSEASGIVTSEIYRQQMSPLDTHLLAHKFREIESCLVRADQEQLDTVLQKLFLSDIRYSYSTRICDYALVEIARLVRRYNDIFLSNLDLFRYEDLNTKSYLNINALYEAVREILQDCAKASLKSGVEVGPISLAAVQYLRTNYAKSFTVKSMAQHIGISPNYLSQVFNKEIGESIPSYSAKIRLNIAMILLKTTDLSISEIGKRAGFGNSPYFTYLFKQKLGVTPAQFRTNRESNVAVVD